MFGYLYFMKGPVLIFVSLLTILTANGQSLKMKEVFRLLPADKVFDLTVATRDSMLQGKTYYPATNDSNEILAYNYGASTAADDYLYISYSFESGQRGYGMIEIRSFTTTSGEKLVLVSETGGVPQVTFHQNDLSVFTYTKNKKLIPSSKKVLPAIDETIFMKPGIPDSVKKFIMNNSNMTFDLGEEKLMLSLNSDYLLNHEVSRKWLKGDVVYFDWIKDRFVIGEIINSLN